MDPRDRGPDHSKALEPQDRLTPAELNWIGWTLLGAAVLFAAIPYLFATLGIASLASTWHFAPTMAAPFIAIGGGIPGFVSHRRDPDAEGVTVALSSVGATIALGFFALTTWMLLHTGA